MTHSTSTQSSLIKHFTRCFTCQKGNFFLVTHRKSVNNHKYGALHSVNAPYRISELLAAALRYRNARSKLSDVISDRINPILAIASLALVIALPMKVVFNCVNVL